MIVLAADTSTAYYSVAAVSDERVVGEVAIHGDRRHSERLLETTAWLLRECGLEANDLDALAISHGPGSFTGLRVGVSAWKGLALGWNLPLVGVGTLDAFARQLSPRDGAVCPVLDAKMAEVFWAVYGPDDAQVEPRVTPVAEMLAHAPDGTLFAGDGAERYRGEILAAMPGARFADAIDGYPRAASVALVALDRLHAGARGDAAAVEPVYLRGSQAEEAKKTTVSA